MKPVVVDTNVLVSAAQFGGKPKQLLDLAVDGHIDLAISEAILEETLRVLRDKFHRTSEELRETDRQLQVIGRMVTPTESINAIPADPSDNHILECAVAAAAEVILSGDKHLLSLGSSGGYRFSALPSFSRAFRNGEKTHGENAERAARSTPGGSRKNFSPTSVHKRQRFRQDRA